MSRLPFVRQVGLLIGLAASVALGGAVIMWSQTPNYRLLYGNISERDVSQVADALTQSNIQYKIDSSSGGIMVAEKQLYDARIKLAAQGLPQSAREGFEVMEKGNGFGTSQFMETARYQRALEGELVRTISSIRSVEGARVHLALPKQSLFLRERQRPSASVFVKLFPGRQLDRGQVAAIVHMVKKPCPIRSILHGQGICVRAVPLLVGGKNKSQAPGVSSLTLWHYIPWGFPVNSAILGEHSRASKSSE